MFYNNKKNNHAERGKLFDSRTKRSGFGARRGKKKDTISIHHKMGCI